MEPEETGTTLPPSEASTPASEVLAPEPASQDQEVGLPSGSPTPPTGPAPESLPFPQEPAPSAPEPLPSEPPAPEPRRHEASPTPPAAAESPSNASPSGLSSKPTFDYPTIGRHAKAAKRERRLEKLIALARERGSISNRDIRKILRVSDATATRYTHELTTRGLLKKSGTTKSTAYLPL